MSARLNEGREAIRQDWLEVLVDVRTDDAVSVGVKNLDTDEVMLVRFRSPYPVNDLMRLIDRAAKEQFPGFRYHSPEELDGAA